MPNIVNEIVQSLQRTDFILPNAVWVLIAVGFFWLLLKSRKDDSFKRKNISVEIKKEFNLLFKMFQLPVNKRIDSGISKVRFAISYIPLYWDKTIPFRANLNSQRQIRTFLKYNKDMAELDKDGKILPKFKPEYKEMYCFKMSGHKTVDKFLGGLGFGVSYMLVPTDLVDITKDFLVIDPKAMPQMLYNTVIFDTSGRQYLENIAYKLNREEELSEVVNFVPKQNFLEVSTAGMVARAREKANIEKEKYKGQIEGAEDG